MFILKKCMLQEVSVSSWSLTWSWGSSVGMVTRLRAGGLRNFSFPSRGKRASFAPKIPRPNLQSTWPPIQWVLGSFSLGVKLPAHEAGHSFLCSTRSRMCEAIHLFSHIPSWHALGQVYPHLLMYLCNKFMLSY